MNHIFTKGTATALAGRWSTLDEAPTRCTWTYATEDRQLRVTRGSVTREQRFPRSNRLISWRSLREKLPPLARDMANLIEQPA
jgi:hypothetical protein